MSAYKYYPKHLCKYVFSRGENKGEACGKTSYDNSCYCSSHLKYKKTPKEKSSVEKKTSVKTDVKTSVKTDVKPKSKPPAKKKSIEKTSPVKKPKKKAVIEIIEDQLIFDECDENEDFLLNVETRFLITKTRKVIGQYHYMTFSTPEFYFVDKISSDKMELIDIHGLQYETIGMHLDPPSIPNKEKSTYDERVIYWNELIERKNKEAQELYDNGNFREAFTIRQAYNVQNKYFTEKEKKSYFADWSKTIFELNDKQYYLTLVGIKCGFFSANGNKCETELNTNHNFCNYHAHLVRSQKNINYHTQLNIEWYKDVLKRAS